MHRLFLTLMIPCISCSYKKNSAYSSDFDYNSFCIACQHIFKCKTNFHTFIVENLNAVNKGFHHIL